MLGLFKKRESPVNAILKASDDEYVDIVKDIFDHLDPATRAHVLVAYQSVIGLIYALQNDAKKHGQKWSLKDFIRDCAERQAVAKDEIDTRRYAWFMWAAMLYRMGAIADGEPSKIEKLGEVWCDLARAAPFLKALLPDNVVWSPEEKAFFDRVIHDDDEELVIWAIRYGGGGVSKTEAVRRLADEYDTISYLGGFLYRTPERLRAELSIKDNEK